MIKCISLVQTFSTSLRSGILFLHSLCELYNCATPFCSTTEMSPETTGIIIYHYDVAVIQWITSCNKYRMITRYITFWRIHVTS